jgi:CRP-like cAMP-binding protein
MPANEVVHSLLSQASLFGGVPADDLEACAAAFEKMHFAEGKTLFVRGDPGTHLYLVEDGRVVRLSISTVKDRKPSFCHTGPDDLFGEIAAPDSEARSADAIAMMEVVVHALQCIAFCPRWSVPSAIAARVVELLCARLRATTTQFESIALLPLELGFFQGELSQLLGASRPKVNAAMGLLERERAVGRTLDRIFCNHGKLAAIARPGLDG